MESPMNNENYIFAAPVNETAPIDEFKVELFNYSTDFNCDGLPLKTVNNFDDLINFIEEMDSI